MIYPTITPEKYELSRVKALEEFRASGLRYVYNWFSNFLEYETPVQDFLYSSIWYKTPENHYQASKTYSRDARLYISTLTASAAKKYGRHKVTLRQNWDSDREGVMAEIQKIRFSQPFWKLLLLAHNAEFFVEWNNWGDKFFGKDIYTGQGENKLGLIITEIKIGVSW